MYIGIDLGTSAVKTIMMGDDRAIAATYVAGHAVQQPGRPSTSTQ